MPEIYFYCIFLFFVVTQMSTLRKRWRLHLMRGEEWFYGVRVQPGFYSGPARDIVRAHHIRLLLPYAVEIVGVALILRFGAPVQLIYLMLGMVVLTVPNHLLAVMAAQRQARTYEIPGSVQTARAVVLPLETRRLRDYTRARLELALLAVNVMALLVLYQKGAGLTAPILMLYLQAGALLIKVALVGWRTVLPADQAEAYAEWREQARRLFLDTCDAVRVLIASELLLAAAFDHIGGMPGLLAATIALMIVWVAWYNRRRNRFLALTRNIRPVKLPGAIEMEEHPRGLLCFRPDYPAMLIKGPQRYSLNLASRRTQAGVAYVAGLAGLCVWIFK